MPIIKHSRWRTFYFAVPVAATLEALNFPLPMNVQPPAGSWSADALSVTVLNVALAVIAACSGHFVLWVHRRRAVSALTLGFAGILSGLELVQFAPFTSPWVFPWYVLIAATLLASIPMSITLLLLDYVFSKRSDPASSLR